MGRFFKITKRAIHLIVYDFDGVLTNNKVFVFEDGKEAVLCHRGDGLAIQHIKQAGIPQMILSTETNGVVETRARKLKIEVIHGVSNKAVALTEYCRARNYDLKKIVYFGNDVNDLEVMKLVGYPLAPKDAHKKACKIAKIVIRKNGGDGVVKEFFDNVLKI